MALEHRSDCWYKAVCQCPSTTCNSCVRYLEMAHLMTESGLPPSKQVPTPLVPEEIDFPEFCRLADIKDRISDLVTAGSFSLYICGENTGNGKTTWAIKILLKYFDDIWSGNGFRVRGLFIHVPTLLLKLKNFQNPLSEEYKQNILDADLVIFDDVAVSYISQYDYSNLLMFLDNRMLTGKSNIFTSNVTTKPKLEQSLGNRLASRIWETSTIVELRGKDRRNGQFADNQQGLND